MTNARERNSHKPTEYSKRNQITSLSFICLSLHTYKMRLTRKNLEYSCQLYNPVIFKMYSIKCSSALCPDSCSSNNFPGEFGLGSLQVCVISEVILQAEATSHTLAPERPHHSSLDAKDPKAKCPPRKRTHNPVNHTGRTGWFCSTFLIAHILLFLSDWKKKILSSIWKILKCEAQCLRQITHRDERGQNSADGITGFASRYASLQTALSWSFAPGSRLWVGWPKSHHSKWDKILGKKEVDKEPAGTNQGFPRRTSLSVQTGKDVTCLGVIAEANRKCVIKSQTWSASWPTAPLRKWFHQHLTLEISYFPACSSLPHPIGWKEPLKLSLHLTLTPSSLGKSLCF